MLRTLPPLTSVSSQAHPAIWKHHTCEAVCGENDRWIKVFLRHNSGLKVKPPKEHFTTPCSRKVESTFSAVQAYYFCDSIIMTFVLKTLYDLSKGAVYASLVLSFSSLPWRSPCFYNIERLREGARKERKNQMGKKEERKRRQKNIVR